MTNCEILCFVLGWQGGTVHQVAQELNTTTDAVINASPKEMRELCRKALGLRNKRQEEMVNRILGV